MKPKQHSLCNASSAGIFFLSNMSKHNIFLLLTQCTKTNMLDFCFIIFFHQMDFADLVESVSRHFLSNLNNFLLENNKKSLKPAS